MTKIITEKLQKAEEAAILLGTLLKELRAEWTQSQSSTSTTQPDRRSVLPFSAVLSDEFLDAALWIEDQIKLSAHNLIVCEGFETGMTFSPSKKNPVSSATGCRTR